MDDFDVLDIMMKHTQNLRRSLSGEPSAATLAAWRLWDVRYEMLRNLYDSQEADDDNFAFEFISEVKRK